MEKIIECSIFDDKFTADWRGQPNKPYKLKVKAYELANDIKFEAEIPKHIFDTLVGSEKDYMPDKFKRKLKAPSVASIVSHMEKFSEAAAAIYRLSIRETEKVILIKFTHQSGALSNSWSSGSEGVHATNYFQFLVCYKIGKSTHLTYYDNKGEYRKNGVLLKEGFGKQMSSFKEIPWTQEREDFLNMVYVEMWNVNNKLDHFLGEMSAEKIDLLIENNQSLLALPSPT